MAPKAQVELLQLSRQFSMRKHGRAERITAVDGLDLSLAAGELFGLLGVNGAGKTTTVKMLSTLLIPTAGDALICGESVRRRPNAVRARIGCQHPGERTLYWKLTARENLVFFAAMYGLPRQTARQRAIEVLTLVGLLDRADERIEKYSTGMRQRIGLGRTIIHRPPVIFLDEPTTGLDVHSARALRALIRDLASAGHTVLMTTHNLAEAEELCDRVGVIDAGRLVALDSPANLRRISSAVDCLRLKVRVPDCPTATMDRHLSSINTTLEECLVRQCSGGLPSVPTVRIQPGGPDAQADEGITVTVSGPNLADQVGPCLVALRDAGYGVDGLELSRPTLEDVFVELTGGAQRAMPASSASGDGA
jgi:ABC-2 type transport system ATP-binding protein